VATWGNLVNRALTFAYKRFDGQVPTPGTLEDVDIQLLTRIEAGFEPVGQLIAGCKLRSALSEVMALAREANRYLEEKGPWFQIKEDREAAGTTIYVALKAIDSLKVLFAPSGCTSIWATRERCLDGRTRILLRKRADGATRRCATTPVERWASGSPAKCPQVNRCANPNLCSRNWTRM